MINEYNSLAFVLHIYNIRYTINEYNSLAFV